MPPTCWLVRARRAALVLALATPLAAAPAHALRIVDYNILNYPGTTGPTRDPRYRTILQPLNADVLITEEMTSSAGVNEFLGSLNTMEPGQWAAAPFVDGNDTDCGLFYKPSKVQFLGQWGFYPNPASLLRLVHVYRLKPVGYTSGATELRLYGMHLKASMGFETQRGQEGAGVRDSMNAMPPGTYAIACGDMNFYTATSEPAYARFTETQVNNVGRLYDVLPSVIGGVTGWHDVGGFASIHTQSPCLSGGTACASGAATGGLDDRFDFFLPTLNLGDGQGMDVVPGSYISVGNDAQHFNKNITDSPTIPEGAAYASALQLNSDHLPIRIDLQLPAILSLDSSAVALGAAIVGAGSPPAGVVTVHNDAVSPADFLDVGATAPAGFQANAPGPIAPGLSGTVQLQLDVSSVGSKSGALTLTSDAPDLPVAHVPLSGTVLDHALPSLDSATVVVADTVDFGAQDSAAFTAEPVAVFDQDYQALRARLSLTAAAITGGDGHFALQGFAPALLAGDGAHVTVTFDPAGATADSEYEATLTFSSEDEPLPGATPLPALTVTLRARLNAGHPAAVDDVSPSATRLYPPSPNPLVSASALRFDLAHAGRVRLELFDLAGRRRALIADRALTPGRYHWAWDGHDGSGRAVDAGVYFVRLTSPDGVQRARLAVVR